MPVLGWLLISRGRATIGRDTEGRQREVQATDAARRRPLPSSRAQNFSEPSAPMTGPPSRYGDIVTPGRHPRGKPAIGRGPATVTPPAWRCIRVAVCGYPSALGAHSLGRGDHDRRVPGGRESRDPSNLHQAALPGPPAVGWLGGRGPVQRGGCPPQTRPRDHEHAAAPLGQCSPPTGSSDLRQPSPADEFLPERPPIVWAHPTRDGVGPAEGDVNHVSGPS